MNKRINNMPTGISAVLKNLVLRFLFLASLTVVSVSASRTASAQEVAWGFDSGDAYVVEFDQETIVTTEFNLIERKIGSRVQLTMGWNVTAVSPDGVATIDQTIQRIVMTLHAPQVGELRAGQEAQATKIVADTDLAEADTKVARNMLKQIKPLINANFTVTMQPNGAIDSVVASPETLETIRNAPGSMQMRELLTPEGLKQIFGQSIIVLPKSEFKADETWTGTREATTDLGAFTISDQFTFAGDSEFEGETLTTISVSSESTLTPKPDSDPVEFTGTSGTGKIYFDPAAKIFVASEFRNEYKTSKPVRETAINTNTISTAKMRIKKNDSQ